jgi:hypothetical protein
MMNTLLLKYMASIVTTVPQSSYLGQVFQLTFLHELMYLEKTRTHTPYFTNLPFYNQMKVLIYFQICRRVHYDSTFYVTTPYQMGASALSIYGVPRSRRVP